MSRRRLSRLLELLRRTVTTHLNVEMASTTEMVRIAQTIKPHMVTLVPERKDEVTTEGGLDVVLHSGNVEKVVLRFRHLGMDMGEQEIELKPAGAGVYTLDDGSFSIDAFNPCASLAIVTVHRLLNQSCRGRHADHSSRSCLIAAGYRSV